MPNATINTVEIDAVVNTTKTFGVVRQDAASPGGSGAPGEPNESIQFNNEGNFGGNANFLFDKVLERTTLGRNFVGTSSQRYKSEVFIDGGGSVATVRGLSVEAKDGDFNTTAVYGKATGNSSSTIAGGSFEAAGDVNVGTGTSLIGCGANVYNDPMSDPSEVSSFGGSFDNNEVGTLNNAQTNRGYGVKGRSAGTGTRPRIGVAGHIVPDNTAVGSYALYGEVEAPNNGMRAGGFKGGQVNYDPIAADPGLPLEGDLYYNSVTKTFRFYDGTFWHHLGQPIPFAPTCDYNDNGTGYIGLSGHYSSTIISGTSDSVLSSLISRSGTLSKFYVNLTAAPGGGKSLAFKIYINGAGTNIGFTISGANTTGSDLVNTAAVAAGDRVDVEMIEVGSVVTGVRAGILLI